MQLWSGNDDLKESFLLTHNCQNLKVVFCLVQEMDQEDIKTNVI